MFVDEPSVIRVRSHNVPAILAMGKRAEPLLSFANSHFDQIWKYAKNDRDAKQ